MIGLNDNEPAPFPPVREIRELMRGPGLETVWRSNHFLPSWAGNTLSLKSALRVSILGFSLAIVDTTMDHGFAGSKQLSERLPCP